MVRGVKYFHHCNVRTSTWFPIQSLPVVSIDVASFRVEVLGCVSHSVGRVLFRRTFPQLLPMLHRTQKGRAPRKRFRISEGLRSSWRSIIPCRFLWGLFFWGYNQSFFCFQVSYCPVKRRNQASSSRNESDYSRRGTQISFNWCTLYRNSCAM